MLDWTRTILIVILLAFTINLFASAKPTSKDSIKEDDNQTSDQNATTHKELYVIRETVYEVGVLVDVNNTDSDSSQSDTSGSSELV